MNTIRSSYFFSLLMSFALLISPLPLSAMVEDLLLCNISLHDKATIAQHADESYVYLGNELSSLIELVYHLNALDKNTNTPLHRLKNYIESGCTVVQQDAVIEFLVYAEDFLLRNDTLSNAQVQELALQLEEIIKRVTEGTLVVNAQSLQEMEAKRKAIFGKRSYVNIATVNGLLSVNDQLVQNMTAVDLSVTDATIQNLTIVNDIVNVTIDVLSVLDGSISGTLSVNDGVVDNFLRFTDAAGGQYVGLQSPSVVPTSYTVSLPSAAPTANQVLRANATTPTNLEWFTEGGAVAPSASKTIYVAKYGNDTTGNGSFDTPYLTLAKAIDVANGIASVSNPISIIMSAGVYVENNSSGPLIITVEGISIVGDSSASVIILPNTPANNLLLINDTVRISNVTFKSTSALATGVSFAAGELSVLSNVRFVGFLVGVNCAGGATEAYGFNNCLFISNGTAINVNDTRIECNSCSFFGTTTGSATNTGIAITGANSAVIVDGGVIGLCATGASITNDAIVTFSGINFKRNNSDIIQDGASHLTLSACTFEFTDDSSDIDLQVSGAGTVTEIIGCEFSGISIASVVQGTGIQVTDSALVNISGGIMHDYTTAIHLGAPSETLSTVLTAGSLIIRDCTTDILQEGATTLNFNACTASSSKISIDDATNVELAFFDLDDNGALTIGSTADQDTTLIQAAIDPTNHPDINYKSDLYSTQAVGFDNTISATSPTSFFALSNQNTDLTSVTTDRTKVAGIRLVSDTDSPVGGTAALRGWDINKNGSAAELSFQYQNSDIVGQAAVAQHTVMQLDGVNNQLQLPTAGTQILFGGDTNLYRNSANVLKTDDNFIVGTLTPDRAIYTDSGTNQLTSSSVTGTELGYLSGVTSAIQTQINSKVAKAGDTMTGTLQLPAGTTALPSLVFTGSTTSGLSASSGDLSFSTNAIERLKIANGGAISVDAFSTAGVVHNDSSGILSSSLIVDADITNATISNAKLATISSSNTSGAIVVRDVSGNFSANMISLAGAVTNPTDAATKAYVDAVAATGITAHDPALVVSTSDVALSGLQTIDGVTLVANDRVLLVSQTDPVENGLWLAQSGAWTRPADFDTGDPAGQAYVLILSGAVYAGSSWLCSTPTAIIDTDPIQFSLFSLPDVTTGANVGSGTGLVFRNKTGITLNFRSLLAGTHVAITNNADDITLATDATSANTASTIVARDGSGNFSAGTITANLTGSASNNVLKAGDTMTGALQLPAGTTAAPSLNFTGSTTTGLSASGDDLSFSNAGVESMQISSAGVVSINAFGTAGVVHNDASGNLSSSLIVNADVDPAAAIVDTKLATISTAGKVANSATTATSANTANAIVSRDASGNFSAGTIIASLTGAASLNVLKAGDTMTGTLQLPAGTTALPSLVFTGSTTTGLSTDSGDLSFSTDALERMKISNGGTVSINEFTVPGVVHNDAVGDLSSSLIVNADVSATAAIIDTKLATISTAGKVANSATTATSANVANSIVLRNASGNFSAGTVSFTDAIIQNLTIANCIASACITALSAVDESVSGSLSVTDEVVNNSLTITPFSTAGVVHNDSAGLLSSSLIVNADVSATAAIVDTKLATISTAGKVANSATTATSANTANAIVARDASGNFSAGTITANLNGNATTATTATNFSGSLSGDVTGTQSATVVSFVGGQTAANVAAATVLANAATSADTASAIVRRSASGGFSTSAISVADEVVSNSLTITPFSTAGIVHNDSSGLLSSSLIVNADVSATAAIVDTKLATISTAGKVANSATTGTSANTPNTLVLRNGSGNFSAQVVSVVDGVATGNLVLSTNPSTSTAGNILKGTTRFIHNFGSDNTFVGENSGNFTMTGVSNAALGTNTLTNNGSGIRNTAVGAQALLSNTTGSDNTALGYLALLDNVTGNENTAVGEAALENNLESNNTAVGFAALRTNVTGVGNTAVGGNALQTNLASSNTAVGYLSLLSNTTGTANTALGRATLTLNTTGINNTAIGNFALFSNVTGSSNVAVGVNALYNNLVDGNIAIGLNALTANTTGVSNTAVGTNALSANTTGTSNTAFGVGTLANNTSGIFNVAIGSFALPANTFGGGNVAIGNVCLFFNTTGSNNVAIGGAALQNNTIGGGNIALGLSTLQNNTTGGSNIGIGGNALLANTTGINNIAIGASALSANVTGIDNVAVGVNALLNNTVDSNTAVGSSALAANTTGAGNTAVGYNALAANTTGTFNTAVGYQALQDSTIGTENTAMGYNALMDNTTGSLNTAIGKSALRSNTTGSGNTAIGFAPMALNTTGSNNVAIGLAPLQSNTIGTGNIAIGTTALLNNTTGINNTGVGGNVLLLNTTGINNTAIGAAALQNNLVDNNVAIGVNALFANTTGINNTATGYRALTSNTTGTRNTATGYNALALNTTGDYNVAFGAEALANNTTGTLNTAAGYAALLTNTIGTENAAFGVNALVFNTTGIKNTALGAEALRNNTTGVQNTAVGNAALFNNTIGTQNTALGLQALTSNITGSLNTAIGTGALFNNIADNNTAVGWGALAANTTGIENTAVGYQSLRDNTTGVQNTASGYNALALNTTGGYNAAFGTNSLVNNTIGAGNTALGSQAMISNTTGDNNTAVGLQALYSNTTGNNNVAVGIGALISSTNNNNTALGTNAGSGLTTGTNNIYVGIVSAGSSSESNTTRLGGTQTRCFAAGISGVSVTGDVVVVDTNGQLGITVSSERFKHDIEDMGDASSNVLKLRPVTFVYNNDETDTKQYGLIAEEVEKVFPEIVARDENGIPYTVRYHLLPTLLLNEIQKQQVTIEEMKNQYVTIETMNNAIATLQAKIESFIEQIADKKECI